MYIASVCMQQEYCTSCPVRKECNPRVAFYDEKQFSEIIEQTTHLSRLIFLNIGVPDETIDDFEAIFTESINKKRQRELEEHPNYSDL
ncbi:MAG: hypothetical protein HFJ35_02690 [Clostridia bacterium]|nr:hypothetical protein [Clostridia bacterium]